MACSIEATTKDTTVLAVTTIISNTNKPADLVDVINSGAVNNDLILRAIITRLHTVVLPQFEMFKINRLNY